MKSLKVLKNKKIHFLIKFLEAAFLKWFRCAAFREANTMLVTNALSHDMTLLAFVPFNLGVWLQLSFCMGFELLLYFESSYAEFYSL